jgi:acetyl esterase/lipase
MEVLPMAMMILPRINHPMPLTFIPDVQFGEADGKPLLLDVIAPRDAPAAPRPAVVWVHGFGWFAGTRRDNLEISLGAFLATQAFFTVSIEYRLSDEATFPAQIHDVKAAIRWLRANAAAYGIDPDHIGIWGRLRGRSPRRAGRRDGRPAGAGGDPRLGGGYAST